MNDRLLKSVSIKLQQHKTHLIWVLCLCLLAGVVGTSTYRSLIVEAEAWSKDPVCGLEEHTHDMSCYSLGERPLVCGLEESEGHIHGEGCYDEEGNLICGQEEHEGHTHGEECYGEAEPVLICERPEHVHTEECYPKEEEHPEEAVAEETKEEKEPVVEEPEISEEKKEDAVAEDQKAAADPEETALPEKAAEKEGSTALEEPAELEEKEDKEPLEFEEKSGDVLVKVSFEDEEAFREKDMPVTMKVKPIDEDSEEYKAYYNQIIDETKVTSAEKLFLFDITFLNKDGKEVEPLKTASVSFTTEEIPVPEKESLEKEEEQINVVHIPDDGKAEIMDVDVKTTEDLHDDEKPDVAFETDSFSIYGIVYTVDYFAEMDGQTYTWSMEGGTTVPVTDVLINLGAFTADKADAFVKDVENIDFSRPEVLTVELDENDVWVIKSLAPFDTEESMTFTLKNGEVFTLIVTDEQHDPSIGEWDLTHPGVAVYINADPDVSVISTGDDNQQRRDVNFEVVMDYKLTPEVFTAIKSYTGGYPVLTYDLRQFIADNPIELDNRSGDIKDKGTKVGVYNIVDGVVYLEITNLTWLHMQTELKGAFGLKFHMDEERLGIEDKWQFTIPGTDSTFTIRFEAVAFNTSKNVDYDGIPNYDDGISGIVLEKDSDGNYYMNYTATFTTPTKLETLQFIDTLSDNQELVGDVTVTSSKGQSVNTSKTATENGFIIDITPAEQNAMLSDATYTVTYRTKLTAAAVAELDENYKTTEKVKNESDWKVNGSKDVPGKDTEIQPKKPRPVPDPPLKKVNGVTGDAGKFNFNQELTYTLTFGNEECSLKDAILYDSMSALQDLASDITITYGNGQTEIMPLASDNNGWGVKWTSGYSNTNRDLFYYKIEKEINGPVTITYKAKMLSESDAVNLNLIGTKDVPNTFIVNNNLSSYTVGHIDTQEPTTINKYVVNKNGTETYNPGDTVAYTVQFGKPGENMSGIILYDKMTDLQKVLGDITIAFGDGTTETISSGNAAFKWSDDGQYSSNLVDVLTYTVPDGKTGVITVTYDAQIVDKTTLNQLGYWGSQSVNNKATSSREGEANTHIDVDYGKKPVPKVDKYGINLSRTEGNWQPGDTIQWTITYTCDDDMNGMLLEDYMNYLQTFNNDAYISYNGGLQQPMPNSYLKYNDSIVGQSYGENVSIKLYSFKVDQTEPIYRVVITYSTTIIDGDTALANYISGTVNVYNRGVGEGVSDKDDHDTDFPEIPVEKDVKEKGGNVSIDGNDNWTPEETVTYILSYGAKGMQMNGALIYDKMTDVQTLVGDVTVTYYSDPDGTNLVTMTMPLASNNNGSGVKYTDDHKYYVNNMVDVFSYNMPSEDVYGPITVTYDAQMISAATAKENNIGGKVLVGNEFRTRAGTDNTSGYVTYPGLNTVGRIQKTGLVYTETGEPAFIGDTQTLPEGVRNTIDFEEKSVTWFIKVDVLDSAYPLKNFRVDEEDAQYQFTNPQYDGNGITMHQLDYIGAEVYTESGIMLTPGIDYEIKVYDNGKGSFLFKEINEPVYIKLKETVDVPILGTYWFKNDVYLIYDNHNPHVTAYVRGTNDSVIAEKDGEYDPASKLVKWTVILNPGRQPITPDWEQIVFKDYIPDGMHIVNYRDYRDENPSIHVDFDGKNFYSANENPQTDFDITVSNSTGTIVVDNIKKLYPNWVNKRGLSDQKIIITYYTALDSNEWKELTSSETGSKTYENRALFTDGNNRSYSAIAEETIYVANPLSKTEVQEGPTAGTWIPITPDSDGSRERYFWYQIEINPNKETYNRNKPLKLSDYIDPKIDILPESIAITEVVDGVEIDTRTYEENRPTASYNDDSRMLVVQNLQDAKHYFVRYKVRIRASYTDGMEAVEYTISNTATLEGSGVWTNTITAQHKTQEEWASMSGGLQIIKIDENDATTHLPGATFEIYKVNTGIVINKVDGSDVIDTSGMFDTPVEEQFIAEIDQDGDGSLSTFTSNDQGIINIGDGLLPNTLYYWIETKFPEGYLHDTATKHYFVIYYEKQHENGREIAWQLDNIWSKKYGYTIASISDGTSWVAQNSKSRSLSIKKIWDSDFSDTYNTRPDFIKVNLIQIDGAGVRKVYDSTTLRKGSDGKWLDYTNYVWNDLPAFDKNGKPYKYTVEEENVSGYIATYSDNQEGLTTGSITITNTLIPTKTDIFVEKEWVGDSPTDRPDSITVQLMQIRTDSNGNAGKPTAYGDPVTLMPGADKKWTHIWDDLPTKDGRGGTYTYTVKEEDVPDGYAVTYSDGNKGVLSSTSENPLKIINKALGSLKITKELNGIQASALKAANRKLITFTVTNSKDEIVASFTLSDMESINGFEKTIDDLPVGEYKVTEVVPDSSIPEGFGIKSITYSVEEGKTTVVKGQTAEVTVINEYDRMTVIKGSKIWLTDKTHSNPPTLKLTRTAGSVTEVAIQGEDNTFVFKNTVESGDVLYQPVWEGNNYTYANLPSKNESGIDYNYEVSEISFTISTENGDVTYTVAKDGSGYTVHADITGAPVFEVSQDGNNVTNKETTEFEFSKVWKNSVDAEISWPDDTEIVITLYKYTGNNPDQNSDQAVETHAFSRTSVLPDKWERDISSENTTVFRRKELDVVNSNGEKLKYYVIETRVTGWKEPLYKGTDGIDIPRGSDGAIIVNKSEDSYELPHTGGPGTAIFTFLGTILIATAGMLLLRRNRKGVMGL